MWYEDPSPDDQVPTGRSPRSLTSGPGCPARVLRGPQPQGLHPAPAVRHPRPQDVPEDRLPRRRRAPQGLLRPAPRPRAGRGAALLDPVLRRTADKKGEALLLLLSATARAKEAGLIGEKP